MADAPTPGVPVTNERPKNHQGEDLREASLAMMIRRLCSRRPDGTFTINDKVREQALELLRSMGLQGSPLRGSDGELGTGSAAGHTTAEFSSLRNQAHGYGVTAKEGDRG